MPVTIAAALATSELDIIDARALLRHALNANDAYLIAHAGEPLTSAQQAVFDSLVARRRGGAPVAYITGMREFFSLLFKVTPAVLIPRPETELLVEFALDHINPGHPSRVLDLGTGSGCIAVSIAKHRPLARIVAVDTSAAALEVARDNAASHCVANIEFLQSDLYASLGDSKFELIVSNPPYVAAGDTHLMQGDLRFEPSSALAAGVDGLDCIRPMVSRAPQFLRAGGWLAIEHGYAQAARCRTLMLQAGLERVSSAQDLAGIARVTAACRLPLAMS